MSELLRLVVRVCADPDNGVWNDWVCMLPSGWRSLVRAETTRPKPLVAGVLCLRLSVGEKTYVPHLCTLRLSSRPFIILLFCLFSCKAFTFRRLCSTCHVCLLAPTRLCVACTCPSFGMCVLALAHAFHTYILVEAFRVFLRRHMRSQKEFCTRSSRDDLCSSCCLALPKTRTRAPQSHEVR